MESIVPALDNTTWRWIVGFLLLGAGASWFTWIRVISKTVAEHDRYIQEMKAGHISRKEFDDAMTALRKEMGENTESVGKKIDTETQVITERLDRLLEMIRIG